MLFDSLDERTALGLDKLILKVSRLASRSEAFISLPAEKLLYRPLEKQDRSTQGIQFWT
jgi:hypothetical protein